MSDSPSSPDAIDPVHLACDNFEERLHAGQEPQIEDFLAAASPSDRSSLLKKLLEIEVAHRANSGSQPAVEEYFSRFKQHQQQVQEVFLDSEQETDEDQTLALDGTETMVSRDVVDDKVSSLGRYELQNVLGRGAFGTVYRGWDNELGRAVAIKVLHGAMLARARDVRRFLREAQTAAKLNHHSICPVYDMGQVDDTPYLVMRLVEGKSLHELIESGKRIPTKQALHAVYKLTLALTEAHRQGIVHRDLKPANIMLDAKSNELVILDFGLARKLDAKGARLTLSGEVLGTPLYMAPEQVRGEVDIVGPKSDIYSLGIILYKMLAGRGPFVGSVAEVFAQVLYEEPAPPSAFRPNLSGGVDAICLKAIAKEPDDRYESMAEFGRAIANFLKGKSKSAPTQLEKQLSGSELDWMTGPEIATLPPSTGSVAPAPTKLRARDESMPSGAAPSKTTCPKCDAPMQAGALLCDACGFHQGLNQRFDVLAKQHDTPELEKRSRLAEEVGDGESSEALILAVACISPIVAIISIGLLHRIIGGWAFLAVTVLFVILAAVAGWRMDPHSLLLYFLRLRRWRTIWPTREHKVLDMRDGRTTDADVASLKESWELEVLDLENTLVTDAAIEHLARIESLRFVVLRRTQVSADGIAQLKQSLPEARIWV